MYYRWGLWWPRVSGTCPTSSWWSPPWTRWSRTWSGDSVLTFTSMPSSPSSWSCISSSCLCTTPSSVSVLIIELNFIFTLHILEREIFFATLLGNSLWLLALSYYIYITFLGYSSLNMLTRFSWTHINFQLNKYVQFAFRTHFFLAPLTILAVFYLFTLCLNWNLSNSLMYFYKYRVL